MYIYGIMGRIEGVEAVQTAPPVTEQTTAETTTENPETTPVQTDSTAPVTYSTTLDVTNIGKPRFADYSFTAAPVEATEPATTTTTAPPDLEAIIETYETTTTTAATTTAETTTTAVTTTTPPPTTTTTAPTTTTAETTTVSDEGELAPDDEDQEDSEELIPDEDDVEDVEDDEDSDTGETLSVLYNGSVVTGDAADIIARVTMAEIGGLFNKEAIKAQAIAAYTYVKYYNENGTNAVVAMSTPNSRVKECVNEIIGKAIYYDGKLIQSVYCSSTPGYTASSYNVWGVDYPYLRSRVCELDKDYDPNYGVTKTFTASDIKQRVLDTTGIQLEGDPSEWFEINTYVDNVFVGNMTVGGQTTYNNGSKNVTITGRVFREKIMSFDLKSACFEISYGEGSDSFTFTTYGYGHGVGFVQYGADNLANVYGYNYEQILDYYFPGTTVK